MLIDKSRAAMGWNRLPENEQDIAILTWFEILSDAGTPPERYSDCYRSAQQRESERRGQGKERQIITPNDLAVEWLKIKDLYSEIDETRLLPEHASGTCRKCFGTGMERMPDGSVRPGCRHEPGAEPERKRGVTFDQAAVMRAALRMIGSKPVEVEPFKDNVGQPLRCSSCGREANTVEGWTAGEVCNAPLETNEMCPSCGEKSGVLSMNKMVCRNCFHIYECVSCTGVKELTK
jgi:hypothetical protein